MRHRVQDMHSPKHCLRGLSRWRRRKELSHPKLHDRQGLIEIIRELGGEEYRRLALKNIGEFVDYGDLRSKSPEQTRELVKKGR